MFVLSCEIILKLIHKVQFRSNQTFILLFYQLPAQTHINVKTSETLEKNNGMKTFSLSNEISEDTFVCRTLSSYHTGFFLFLDLDTGRSSTEGGQILISFFFKNPYNIIILERSPSRYRTMILKWLLYVELYRVTTQDYFYF